MKNISAFVFVFLVMPGTAMGQAKVQPLEKLTAPDIVVQGFSSPDFLSHDSLMTLSLRKPIDNMPIYNPLQAGAKMLYWWPEENYVYGMPNLFSKENEMGMILNKKDQKKKR